MTKLLKNIFQYLKEEDLSSFVSLVRDFKACEAVCFSNDQHAKRFGEVTVYPWREGLNKFFMLTR